MFELAYKALNVLLFFYIMEIYENGRKMIMLELNKYVLQLEDEQKAKNTISAYKTNVKDFQENMKNGHITMKKLMAYKEQLENKYAPSTVNFKIMSINDFLKRCGINLKLNLLRIRKDYFIEDFQILTGEEINKLESYCQNQENYRMLYLIRTYKKTGIRVSEHEFITVEAVKKGIIVIKNKGTIRKIVLPRDLKKQLERYIDEEGIKTGPIFITRNENPVDRRNIWAELQSIGLKLGIQKEKLHPHNFRHYFARKLYTKEKDINKVAAILGHSSIETTRNYLKLLMSEVRDTMNGVEKEMDGGKEEEENYPPRKKERKRSQRNRKTNTYRLAE